MQEAANARIASLPRVDLLGGAGITAFKISGDNSKAAEGKTITVTGQPFADAMRFTVKEPSSHEWAVQLQTPTTAPVAVGDAILATFWLRTETPQEGSVGETEFVFELGRSPYSKSVQYPIQGGPDWTRVQVRFNADKAYAAGEANMIFRLGYEPQTLDLGGVKVENFGKQIAMGGLPTSQTADRRRAKAFAAAAKEAQASATPVEAGELTFEVDTAKVIRPISPYVYGINSQKDDNSGVTVRRMGGNRQTGYNWENNASNAGSDYEHQSDEWPCTVLGYKDCGVPGRAVHRLRAGEQDAGRRDAGDDPDRRLRRRRQEQEGRRGGQGAERALGEVDGEEAGAAQPHAESRRQGRLPGRVREPAGEQAGQGRRRAASSSTRSTTSRRCGPARTRASTPSARATTRW